MGARVPSGTTSDPHHSHSARWELYLVLSGKGVVPDETGTTEVTCGEALLFAPGEAHHMSSAGQEDLVYYVVSDNRVGDSCYHPDSGKWPVPTGSRRTTVRGTETSCFDGEE